MTSTEQVEANIPESNNCYSTWLIKVGSAFHPLDHPPTIIPLDGRDELILGRQNKAKNRLPSSPGKKIEADPVHRVEIDDRWMSTVHAQLTSSPQGWRIMDLDSANGTFVWGKRSSEEYLQDGDVFETGSTFWVFRQKTEPATVYEDTKGLGLLVTVNPAVAVMHDKLRRLANSKVPILFQGSTGTGKEVLARTLHQLSDRSGKMVVIAPGTLSTTNASLELFGSQNNSGDESQSRQGRLRLADNGTVLLDEIADIPLDTQALLLRVLQAGEVLPVGSDEPISLDARFICTTQHDPETLVDSGKLRADLWSRIKGYILQVPDLKYRIEDLGLLLSIFLKRFKLTHLSFSLAAYRALISYNWPLNIRELERTIESAAALCRDDRIDIHNLPDEIRRYQPVTREVEHTSTENRQKQLIRLLSSHRGNVSAVARAMGYSRMQVHRWMKQLNLDPSEFRRSSNSN